ncbi:MAG TPA: ferritin-like domain-containing protein [Thermoanaerobaculia bacterium]|nr:ferritin-like domain-containing protein [Thermoanaerobaculia bacterium]
MSKKLVLGSEEHKQLLCRTFIDTHDPFKPEEIRWPDLDPEGLARLKAMPVWNEATRTEAATAVKVQSLGDTEKDPLLAEAISLQGYEEGRHADVLKLLTKHYGIEVAPYPPPEVPKDPTLAFLRTGYGECLDSFFAFGLFRLGVNAELFPKALTDVFEQIMQEEARHILFIVNWAAYLRARRPVLLRPGFDLWRGWNIVAQAFDRLKGALAMAGGDSDKKEKPADPSGKDETQVGFTLKTHSIFGDFSLRSFLETCLAENDKRLARYDERLLRPMLVPSVVRAMIKVLPRKKSSGKPVADSKAA